jgi:hypothetical protein
MRHGYLAVALGLLIGVSVPAGAAALAPAGALESQADREAAALFTFSRVWDLRLTLTPEAWKAMQPPGGEPRFGFGGGRSAASRGRGGGAGGSGPGGRPIASAGRGGEGGRPTAPPARSSRGGLAGRMGLEYPEVRATLFCSGRTYTDVGLRYKGNGTFLDSRGTLKRPLKLDFDAFVKGQKFHGVTTLNLNNNVTDPSFMREALGYLVYREAGVPAPRTGYARVYLTVPGEHESRYLGLYTMVEQVDEAFFRRHFQTEKGLLLKPDFVVGLPHMGDDWAAYEVPYRPRMKGERQARERFMALTKLLKEADASAFAAQVGSFIDLDEFARFLAATVLLANTDSILVMGQNYYVYLPSGHTRFLWMPWDLDRAFGNFTGGPERLTQMSIRRPHSPENLLIDRLLAVPEVDQLYRKHLQTLIDTVFRPDRLGALMVSIGRVIRPAVAAQSSEALRLFDVSLSEKSVAEERSDDEGRGFGSRRLRPAYLKRFVTLRSESVREQLAGRSEGVPTTARNFLGGGRRPGGRAGAPAPSGGATAVPTPPPAGGAAPAPDAAGTPPPAQ